ncbi:hypothetical protein [Streptomyces sp. NPDC054975]
MADERYPWLDQEAAERLLRGEPVDAVDDHNRAEAERLARALAEARTACLAHTTDTELPGEAAALAAFRAAAAERGQTVRSAAHASPVPPDPQATVAAVAELDAVRITRAEAARRWGRSLRYGLAAAVAAVAVGGVAVASGAGMLPFTEDGPAPAGSVSAADTPGPVSSSPDSSQSSGPHVDSVTPSAPRTGSPGASPSSPGTSAPPATSGSGGGTGGTDGGATPEPGTSTGPRDNDGEITGARLIKACQDYRAGRIDATAKDRLAKSARTGETLRRFCDRVLADPAGSSGRGDGESSGDRGGEDSSGDGEGERTGPRGSKDPKSSKRGGKRDDGRARNSAAVGSQGLAPTGEPAPDRAVDSGTAPLGDPVEVAAVNSV